MDISDTYHTTPYPTLPYPPKPITTANHFKRIRTRLWDRQVQGGQGRALPTNPTYPHAHTPHCFGFCGDQLHIYLKSKHFNVNTSSFEIIYHSWFVQLKSSHQSHTFPIIWAYAMRYTHIEDLTSLIWLYNIFLNDPIDPNMIRCWGRT